MNKRRISSIIIVSSITLILIGLASCEISPNTLIPAKLTPTPEISVAIPAASPVPPEKPTSSPSIVSVISGNTSIQIFGDWILYWSSTPVRTFAFDKNGTVWIGWHGKVIHLFPETDTNIVFNFDEKYDLREIEFDKSGDVWVGAPILQYVNKGWVLFEYNYTTPMILSADNTIWVTSTDFRRSDCIVHFDRKVWTQFCPKIDDVKILDLEIDNENNLWVSLRDESFFNEGVWKFKGTNWEQMDELKGVNLSSPFQISQTSDGILWFVSPKHTESGENGQIKTFDGKNWLINIENTEMVSVTRIAPDNTLWGLASDSRQNYLLRFNKDKWEKVLFENDLESIFGEPVDIYTFGFDPSSKLCLGTSLGLICKIE